MSDVRELVDGSTTVRVSGLDAKATSLGTVHVELRGIVAAGLTSATAALESWRGRRAETFVEDANEMFRKLDAVVTLVSTAKRTALHWPDRPGRPPREEESGPPRVEIPEFDGTSSANPDRLDDFRLWSEDACARLPTLTAGVNLDGVTAEVTRPEVSLGILGGPPVGYGTVLVDEPQQAPTMETDYDPNDPDDVEASQDFEHSLIVEDADNRAVWLVKDLFDAPTEQGARIRDDARGQPFVDASGALLTDMSTDEVEAFREWATGLRAEGGPLYQEDGFYIGGAADLSTPALALEIENRY